jgi:hypothetical protein
MRSVGSSTGRDAGMANKDALFDVACERADDILRLYRQFAEKKPVMLLELPSQRIYAYPYLEFKNTLSERSQKMLDKEYHEALAHHKIVVFVKDDDRRKMISFSVEEE